MEDELLIGMDLEDVLGAAGYEPLWFPTQRGALSAIERRRPDIAVIDVQLQDGDCAELVRELIRRDIPFIVHSASAASDASPDLADVTWLMKPAKPPAILKALKRARRAASTCNVV